LGERLGIFDKLFDQVSEFAPVLAYDRLAKDKSESMGLDLTIEKLTSQLHELLGELKLSPPYIFVGHNWGSVFAREFALNYPDEVSGMIYLDPIAPTENLDQLALELNEAGVNGSYLIEEYRSNQMLGRFRNSPREMEFMQQLMANESSIWKNMKEPNVPSIIMLSRRNDIQTAMEPIWKEGKILADKLLENRTRFFLDLTSDLSNFSLVLTPSSFNYLPLQSTTSVTLSIQELIYSESSQKVMRAAQDLSPEDFATFIVGLRTYLPDFLLSESELNMLGYSLMRQDQFDHALVLFEDNLENHPNSANVYDSFGDGLLAVDRVQQAAQSFEKAVELGKKSNHRDLELFTKNLSRTEAALNK
jgi:tetratricopeptide (TPR) repeat protein